MFPDVVNSRRMEPHSSPLGKHLHTSCPWPTSPFLVRWLSPSPRPRPAAPLIANASASAACQTQSMQEDGPPLPPLSSCSMPPPSTMQLSTPPSATAPSIPQAPSAASPALRLQPRINSRRHSLHCWMSVETACMHVSSFQRLQFDCGAPYPPLQAQPQLSAHMQAAVQHQATNQGALLTAQGPSVNLHSRPHTKAAALPPLQQRLLLGHASVANNKTAACARVQQPPPNGGGAATAR